MISTKIEDIVLTKLTAILKSDYTMLSAYKMGLIDSNGNILKTPQTALEQLALPDITIYALELKNAIENRTGTITGGFIDLYTDIDTSGYEDIDLETPAIDIIKGLSMRSEKSISRDVDDHIMNKQYESISEKYLMLNPKKRASSIHDIVVGVSDE